MTTGQSTQAGGIFVIQETHVTMQTILDLMEDLVAGIEMLGEIMTSPLITIRHVIGIILLTVTVIHPVVQKETIIPHHREIVVCQMLIVIIICLPRGTLMYQTLTVMGITHSPRELLTRHIRTTLIPSIGVWMD